MVSLQGVIVGLTYYNTYDNRLPRLNTRLLTNTTREAFLRKKT